MLKRILAIITTAFVCALIPAGASAKTVSPQAALERATDSNGLSARGVRLPKSVENASAYTLAYSAPGGSYHVFNRNGGGYIIVSGDDRAYPLLSVVESGSFDADEMNPAAKWLVGEYESQISSLPADGGSESTLPDYYNKWTEIKPLMSTKWDQISPYNKFCPVISGVTCVTGCVATAMAQVVRCIGYYDGKGYRSQSGVNANGEKIEFDYASAKFDFDNMFDTYPSSVSQESVDGVARLMLACGLSVGMGYSTSASAADSRNLVSALIDHFGYDKNYTQIYFNENYTQAQWENMLYTQLKLGRPVYYSGSGKSSGHAFVIDGYLPAGLYHVNWGWSGMSDGYFRLSALDPSQAGTGGYNIGQQMVCAVPPDADPGVVYGEMGGSINMVSDGVYAIYYKCTGFSLTNVSVGAVIVDSTGSIVDSVTFWAGQNISANSAILDNSHSYDFTQHALPAGEYRIYPAYRHEGGEYMITDKVTGRPYFVNLTVTAAGEYIFSNLPETTVEPDLHIAGIYPDYDLRTGFSGALGFYVVNSGGADYEGSVKLCLLNAAGEELASYSSQSINVAARSNTVVYSSVPVFDTSGSVIQAGTYSLRFYNDSKKMISDGEFSVEIKNGTPLSEWTTAENIKVTNAATIPSTIINGDYWPHTPFVKTLQTNRNMTLRLAFYPPSSTASSKVLLCFQGTIEPRESMFPIDPLVVDVPLGEYEVCYRKGYSQISQRRRIRVGENIDGIYYLPSGGDGVSATMMQTASGLETIVVPSQISAGGVTRTVSAIEPQAFTSESAVTVVDIPSSVTTIGSNAFVLTPMLKQIMIRSEEPPFKYIDFIAPGLSETVEFYVPAASYDKYKPLLEGHNPLYTIVESVGSASVSMDAPTAVATVSFGPAHEAVNRHFVVTPADDESAAVAEVRVESVESDNLNLAIKALKKGVAEYHILPAHRSDDYGVLRVTVPETMGIDEIDADRKAHWPADIYTVTGIPVKYDAPESFMHSLPKGVYILRSAAGTRKVIR